MELFLRSKILLCIFVYFLSMVNPLPAQLNDVFNDIFKDIVGDQNGFGGSLIPVVAFDPTGQLIDNHGNHFIESSSRAANELSTIFNRYITSRISSFPLSSTSQGIIFDFSEGQAVEIKESLGPIFAETGKTQGKGRLSVGYNYSRLGLSNLEGFETRNLQITLTHVDIGEPGLGDISTESDIIHVRPNLDIDANYSTIFATFGILERWDLGIVFPLINIRVQGNSVVEIQSFTIANSGFPFYQFGTEKDPTLSYEKRFGENAFGIGDIRIRLKHLLYQKNKLSIAALLETRLPTGEVTNYMGTGNINMRLLGILSKEIDDFTPHVNLGYDFQPQGLESDEFEFALGFDHKIIPSLTISMDILGRIEVNKDEEKLPFLEGNVDIIDHFRDSTGIVLSKLPRQLAISNLAVRNDNIINASFGFKYAPIDQIFLLANMMLPLNEVGLRSKIIPTFGISIQL